MRQYRAEGFHIGQRGIVIDRAEHFPRYIIGFRIQPGMHTHGGTAFGGFAIQHKGRDKGAHQHIQRHAPFRPSGLGPFKRPAPRRRNLLRPTQIGSTKQIPLGPEIIMKLREIDPRRQGNRPRRSAGIAMIGKEHLRHIQNAVTNTGRRVNRGKQAGHGLQALVR